MKTTATKYNSIKAQCKQGHTHDSRKEARRCDELHDMQRRGLISGLKTQQEFVLIESQKFKTMSSERPCKYIADFTYFCEGVFVIEDCKGCQTKDYIIKRKILKRRYCKDGEARFIET